MVNLGLIFLMYSNKVKKNKKFKILLIFTNFCIGIIDESKIKSPYNINPKLKKNTIIN